MHDYGLCAWSEITCAGCYCIVTLGSGLIICNSLVPRSFFSLHVLLGKASVMKIECNARIPSLV